MSSSTPTSMYSTAPAGRRSARQVSDICTLLPDRSQLTLPRLVTEEFVADAAFVDGSHDLEVAHGVGLTSSCISAVLVRCPGALLALAEDEPSGVSCAAPASWDRRSRRPSPIREQSTF